MKTYIDNIYSRDTNPEAWTAWQIINETSVNIFLTGKAGTGKTTFLRHLSQHSPKRMAIVAPTGVAAINAGGVTIHSFFQLPFSPFIPGAKLRTDYTMRKERIRILRTLDLLVIDEISMVRADLLDAIDATLRHFRRNDFPFGGVQLVMIGDLQQLPPVVVESEREIIEQHYSTPYFFSSQALQQSPYATVELKTVYRQSDQQFIDILNQIRDNHVSEATLNALNCRYIPDFNPDDKDGYIRLTTHNNQADNINSLKLLNLDTDEQDYECSVQGTFPEASFPADKLLKLKVGAQVMFLKNDKNPERRYYNGKIGVVTGLKPDMVRIRCISDNVEVEVEYEEWSNTKYVINPVTSEMDEKVEGTFRQIPLRLAWAVTIHKSQGLTFDRAIIDANQSFAHGQVYVALSRCRTLQGIVLSSRINYNSVISDCAVSAFISQQSQQTPGEKAILDMKANYAVDLVKQLYYFRHITSAGHRILRLFEEYCSHTYPMLISEIKAFLTLADNDIIAVADKFVNYCIAQRQQGVDIRDDNTIMDRIANGAKYFKTKTTSLLSAVVEKTDVEIDRKEVAKQLSELRLQMDNDITVKCAELKAVAADGFEINFYLHARALAIIETEKKEKKPAREPKAKTTFSADIKNQKLYDAVVKWRKNKADENDVPAFQILTQKAVIDLVAKQPDNLTDLRKVNGFGAVKTKQFGEEIIQLVQQYKID